MINRLNGWRRLWAILAVVWTMLVMIYGWLNLPRAPYIPHEPQFLHRLSNEAASIMRGSDASAKQVRGPIVWSENPRVVRMTNGAALTFPANTTRERAEFVAGEYRQVLKVAANSKTAPYLLEMLAIWLAPLLVTGLAISLIGGRSWAIFCALFDNEQSKHRDTATLA